LINSADALNVVAKIKLIFFIAITEIFDGKVADTIIDVVMFV